MTRSSVLALAVFCGLALSVGLVSAETPAAVEHYNLDKNKLAVQGYDVVSYFLGEPVEGQQKISVTHEGVVYRFTNHENHEAFVKEPAKYKPAYGGWCASAMAFGKKVEIDPKNFKIVNGRLMLFYRSFFQNALTDWNKNEKEWLPKADEHWLKISGEK